MSTEPEPSDRPPVRVWRRIFLATGALVLLVVVLAVARSLYDGARAASRLEALLAELDATDPGWKLPDIEAARQAPAGANSAEVVVRVARLVPGNWPPWEVDFD